MIHLRHLSRKRGRGPQPAGPRGPTVACLQAVLLDRLPASLRRTAFNVFPCYRGSGARVVRITPDYREVDVDLPLSWRTRNYVGSIFGGSMFAAVDPFYMIMLIHLLGPEYVVWDKGASIRFRRPA